MKEVTLECFKNFRCTADACKDNCCIGWEIDIDEDTLKYYNTLTGDMSVRLKSGIATCGTPHFITDERGRCPFLNSSNLCDIIISLGEDKIPYICKNHPRFFTMLSDRVEMGIGLCCPEGARLLLSSKDKLQTHIDYEYDGSTDSIITYTRDIAFSILQNRNYPLSVRLTAFYDYCKELDEFLFFDDFDGVKKVADSFKICPDSAREKANDIDDILRLYKGLAPINQDWTTLVDTLCKNRQAILENNGIFPGENVQELYLFEHLGVYFTYRHFIKGMKEGDILSAGKFIILSVIFCGICDSLSRLLGNNSSTAENASLYSKQVEYSTENTEAVYCEDISNIKGLIRLIFGENKEEI
ncbi:MAG: hypothetical protein E7417_03070 [Ruminococcaceae bacterium]|nr:hypothetical protein [Oscillospiraceae bacterium]